MSSRKRLVGKPPLNTALQNPESQQLHGASPVNRSIQSHHRVEYSFSGPLPPAHEVAGYEKTLPGAAERIFQMREMELNITDKQVTHRIEIEDKVISSDIRNSRNGVISANVFVFCGLALTGLFVMTGHDKAGEIIGPAVIGSVLTAFITGNISRSKERGEKMKLLVGQTESDNEADQKK